MSRDTTNWTMETNKCLICSSSFTVPASRKGKYCSRACANKNPNNKRSLGRHHTEEWKKNMSESMQGKIPINVARGDLTGKNHPLWKGDKVSNRNLHRWVIQYLGQPTKCEHCGKDGLTEKKIYWANKSHKYLRKLTDWIRLCASCHGRYDARENNPLRGLLRTKS